MIGRVIEHLLFLSDKSNFRANGPDYTYFMHAGHMMGTYFAEMAGADPHLIARLGL